MPRIIEVIHLVAFRKCDECLRVSENHIMLHHPGGIPYIYNELNQIRSSSINEFQRRTQNRKSTSASIAGDARGIESKGLHPLSREDVGSPRVVPDLIL